MQVLRVLFTAAWVGAGLVPAPGAVSTPPRPNILWITTEDINPHLGCYGDRYARTPNLDRFAQESVRYTHAFATGPVCSPARSCLITGLYATTLGTMHLRSQFPVPAQFKGFPAYLRAAGYFTSNNSKTDYNLRNEAAYIQEAWNVCGPQAHWRQRRPGQPFFSVFNIMITHQSFTSVLPWEDVEQTLRTHLTAEERHDPAQASVPPYYPDTPTVRRTLARYHDCITAMDKAFFATLLKELEADGLAEQTIVFFYGDNGAGLPRHKRLPHDSGMRVPLLIRFPKQYQHLAPAAPGKVVDRLVSFVDFAPTVLSLAGVAVPAYMQGGAFLGPSAAPPREFVFGARDRVDEAFDMSRMVRDRRYLYLRNYMPHLSWCQPEHYSDAADMRREIVRLAGQGRLNADQLTYAGPRKPLEELYDSEADSHQIHNLAGSPAYQAVLQQMRQRQRDWQIETRDLGFLSEQEVLDRCEARTFHEPALGGATFLSPSHQARGDRNVAAPRAPTPALRTAATPHEFARTPGAYPLERIREAADRVGRAEAVPQQIRLLADPDSAIRYWAAVGLRAAGRQATAARAALRKATDDRSAPVRIEAAAALAAQGWAEPALPVLRRELEGDQLDTVLHAARVLELMGAEAKPVLPVMRKVLAHARASEKQQPHWLFIGFSLDSAIKQLEP